MQDISVPASNPSGTTDNTSLVRRLAIVKDAKLPYTANVQPWLELCQKHCELLLQEAETVIHLDTDTSHVDWETTFSNVKNGITFKYEQFVEMNQKLKQITYGHEEVIAAHTETSSNEGNIVYTTENADMLKQNHLKLTVLFQYQQETDIEIVDKKKKLKTRDCDNQKKCDRVKKIQDLQALAVTNIEDIHICLAVTMELEKALQKLIALRHSDNDINVITKDLVPTCNAQNKQQHPNGNTGVRDCTQLDPDNPTQPSGSNTIGKTNVGVTTEKVNTVVELFAVNTADSEEVNEIDVDKGNTNKTIQSSTSTTFIAPAGYTAKGTISKIAKVIDTIQKLEEELENNDAFRVELLLCNQRIKMYMNLEQKAKLCRDSEPYFAQIVAEDVRIKRELLAKKKELQHLQSKGKKRKKSTEEEEIIQSSGE